MQNIYLTEILNFLNHLTFFIPDGHLVSYYGKSVHLVGHRTMAWTHNSSVTFSNRAIDLDDRGIVNHFCKLQVKDTFFSLY